MALTINTNIKNDADGYSLDASQVKGTYVVVADEAGRAAIPSATKIIGTTVYMVSNGKEYRWDGKTWQEVIIGSVAKNTIIERGAALPTTVDENSVDLFLVEEQL